MKKTINKFYRVLVLGALMCPLVSCEKEIENNGEQENEEVIYDNPLEDVVDVTTTGSVDELGFSYAVIGGSVDELLLSLDSDVYSCGVEICDDSTAVTKEFVATLNGVDFSVLCRDLSPGREYSYRSFVKYDSIAYYGESKRFATKEFDCELVAGDVVSVGNGTATVTFEVQVTSSDEKESWNAGIAYYRYTAGDSLFNFKDFNYCFQPDFDKNVGMGEVQLDNLYENSLYYYVAAVKVGDKVWFSDYLEVFRTKGSLIVDLGLSVDWASCNVGASVSEEFGGYYAWGETKEKNYYSMDTQLFYMDYRYDEVFNIQGTSYDVAHVKWGNGWRMPTMEEFRELMSNCDVLLYEENEVPGCLVLARNGNSIFLPAAGYRDMEYTHDIRGKGCYWSATGYDDGCYGAIDFDFDLNELLMGINAYNSYMGFSVRPVKDK